MDTITRQDRITLKNLKVADFASEETLCFTAFPRSRNPRP